MSNLHVNTNNITEHTKESFEVFLKQKFKIQEWFFFKGLVNNNTVALKLFPGKRQVDVQIFTVNDKTAHMPRNYSTRKDTLQMILSNFPDE
jgi:hypothetical protein